MQHTRTFVGRLRAIVLLAATLGSILPSGDSASSRFYSGDTITALKLASQFVTECPRPERRAHRKNDEADRFLVVGNNRQRAL